MKHFSTPAADILAAFGAFDDPDRPQGWRAFCPHPKHSEAGRPGAKASLIIDITEAGRALVHCQSRNCDYGEILAAVGLTPDMMNHITYRGQSIRGRREAVAATPEQRSTIEARAYRAALTLEKMRDAGHHTAVELAERFGLPEGYSPYELGIGYEKTAEGGETVVFARTPDGKIAWFQRRNLADPEGGWISAPNFDKGTEDETRLDAVGRLGTWRGSGPVIIAEGASDGITAAALGTFDTIAVRGATMAARIGEVRDLLVGRSVVVIGDDDAAGETMTRAIIDATDPYVASASWVRWGSGIKGFDIRDFRDQSPANFRTRFTALVTNAERHYRQGPGFDATPYIYRGGEGMAAALRDYIRHLGYDLAFTGGAGWAFYTGTRWEFDAEPVLFHLAGRLARDYGAIVAAERSAAVREAHKDLKGDATDAQIQEATRKAIAQIKPKAAFVGALQTAGMVKGAFAYLQGHTTITAELADFDRDPDVLAAANGVIELRTGKLRDMRASDKITARLAVGYRAGATAPRFEAFLREVFVTAEGKTDDELVAYMKRLIGYAITGHSSEQAFWLLHSPRGSNGKSQFLSILQHVFAAITESTSFSTFETGSANDNAAFSDLASLRQARLVVASEGSGRGLNEDRLKAVTGEDLIKAKFMRRDMFAYRAKFAMLLATNNIPEFSDDPAVWRRVRIVPFLRHFTDAEQVKGIGASIADEEAEGILALAVAEAAKWYAEGLPACRAVVDRTQDEQQDTDPLAMFLEFNVDEGKDRFDGHVLLSDLWLRFVAWSTAMGADFYRQDDLPQSARQLKKALVRRWDLPANQNGDGTRKDAFPVRWRGRRLVAPGVVNERFNAMRADVLGMDDYIATGAQMLSLGDDPGVQKYAPKFPGLKPRE